MQQLLVSRPGERVCGLCSTAAYAGEETQLRGTVPILPGFQELEDLGCDRLQNLHPPHLVGMKDRYVGGFVFLAPSLLIQVLFVLGHLLQHNIRDVLL